MKKKKEEEKEEKKEELSYLIRTYMSHCLIII